jgi:hypothetical protein
LLRALHLLPTLPLVRLLLSVLVWPITLNLLPVLVLPIVLRPLLPVLFLLVTLRLLLPVFDLPIALNLLLPALVLLVTLRLLPTVLVMLRLLPSRLGLLVLLALLTLILSALILLFLLLSLVLLFLVLFLLSVAKATERECNGQNGYWNHEPNSFHRCYLPADFKPTATFEIACYSDGVERLLRDLISRVRCGSASGVGRGLMCSRRVRRFSLRAQERSSYLL